MLNSQVKLYPSTRYMGSKSKLLEQIWDASSKFEFDSVIDLFSGSGIVSYMYKAQGKRVISNDYMAMDAIFTKSLIENNEVKLDIKKANSLLLQQGVIDNFVYNTFKGLYFSDEENHLVDILRSNIKKIDNDYERAIAMNALIRACIKKRPRGIFTYVGNRYDDGRRDLKKSFQQQYIEAVETINEAVFSNKKKNISIQGDALVLNKKADLIYIDPPYYSPHSDNEYVRRYHFAEGLARDWQGVEIQEHTLTKKFKSYPTPFSSRTGAEAAFDTIFKKYQKCILIVSYSSNSLPTLDEMITLMKRYKQYVNVIPIEYKYSFGNQGNKINDNRNTVQEYLFVGY